MDACFAAKESSEEVTVCTDSRALPLDHLDAIADRFVSAVEAMAALCARSQSSAADQDTQKAATPSLRR